MKPDQRQVPTEKIVAHKDPSQVVAAHGRHLPQDENDLFHPHEVSAQEDTETVARSRSKFTAMLSKNSGVYLPIGVIIAAGWFMAQHFYSGIVGQQSVSMAAIAELRSENEKQEIRLTVLSERADAKSDEIREIKRVLDLVNAKLDDLRARGVSR